MSDIRIDISNTEVSMVGLEQEKRPHAFAVDQPTALDLSPGQRWAPWRLFAPLGWTWKFLLGMFFSQSLLGGIYVVGWSQRWMRRVALRYLWSLTPNHEFPGRPSSQSYLNALGEADVGLGMPNWLMPEPQPGQQLGFFARLRGIPRNVAKNLARGFGLLFNTWLFTVPSLVVISFAWYDGWNNSFFKGYEQHYVGLAISLLAISVWIAAMFYIPLVQARQAFCDDWRIFYDFGVNLRLIRRAGLWMLWVGGVYFLLSIPPLVIRFAPYFLTHELDPEQVVSTQDLAKQYRQFMFAASPVVLACYCLARIAATRTYAYALAKEAQYGQTPLVMAEMERKCFAVLELPRQISRPKPFIVRSLLWTWGSARNAGVVAALFIIWFFTMFSVYVQQFLNYIPFWGWMNHPLVHTPWLRSLPATLTDGGEVFFGWLLLLACAAFFAYRAGAANPSQQARG